MACRPPAGFAGSAGKALGVWGGLKPESFESVCFPEVFSSPAAANMVPSVYKRAGGVV